MAWVASYTTHTFIHILLMPSIIMLLTVIMHPLIIFKLIHKFYTCCFYSKNLKGKVILITGASSGIGEQLANEYAKRGACVAIVARRESQLRKIAEKARTMGSPNVLPICADVSNVKDCKRFVEETVNHFGRLDCLVNNAGITSFCSMQDVTDITKVAPVMDVNFWGSIYPTYFAIPHLKKARGNIIVNSSSAAFINPPGACFYNASKAALFSFYETIGVEMAPEISVTIATLGFIDSEMTRGKHLSREGTVQVDSKLAKTVNQFPLMSSKDCAKSIIDAACRRERNITEPKWYKGIIMLKYFCPELVEWFSTKFIVPNRMFRTT